jgi:hypothetical protein
MNRLSVMLVAGAIACSSSDGEPEDPATTPQSAGAPAAVSLDAYQQVQWIAGRWLGSGGAYPAFYEEYRIVDDSTIQMRAFPDSTFTAATDSSWMELRNGEVRKRGNNRAYVVIAISADSIRFAVPGMKQGGHTFTHTSADEWTATLHPSGSGGRATVYTMRRLQR